MDAPTAGWGDFLVAASGATGALTGLLFVALSINLSRIIGYPSLPGRAAETLLVLAAALTDTLLALVPGQPARRLGVEFLIVALVAWVVPVSMQIEAFRKHQYPRARFPMIRLVLHQSATIPLVAAGLSLMGFFAGGLGWLALAIVTSIVFSLTSIWVLLVEILR